MGIRVREVRVGDIVKGRPVYFALESDSAAQAARYMTEHQIGAVPVLDEGYKPGVFVDQVGIFSERDLMTRVVAEGLDPIDTRVRDVMTQKVAVLDPESSSREALAMIGSASHTPSARSGGPAAPGHRLDERSSGTGGQR